MCVCERERGNKGSIDIKDYGERKLRRGQKEAKVISVLSLTLIFLIVIKI